jgi:death on curing protein
VTRFLSTEDLLDLAVFIDLGPVRDFGLLESAAARPQAIILGRPAYPNDPTRAAALLHSLVKNHPLVDGNKRLGWFACMTFLDLNGLMAGLSDDDGFDLAMAVAQGLSELDQIATRLHVIALARPQ